MCPRTSVQLLQCPKLLCGSLEHVLKFMLYSKKTVKMCEQCKFSSQAFFPSFPPFFPWSFNVQIEKGF